MIYHYEISDLPKVSKYYLITRLTSWQSVDECNILIFILNGECNILTESSNYHLYTGDVFFLPVGTSYKRYSANGKACTMAYIHFSFASDFSRERAEVLQKRLLAHKNALDIELMSGSLNRYYDNKIYLTEQMHLYDMSALEYFSGNQFDDGRKNPFTFNLKISINFCGILCSLSAYTLNKIISLDDRHSILDTPYKLQKAVNYISKHYNEKITLDELAAYCNISKQQLTRQFKTNLQMTPMKYVTEFKLLRAKDLIFNQPELSIKEVSDMLGFDNQNYFSKVFARVFGQSPTEYKSSAKA